LDDIIFAEYMFNFFLNKSLNPKELYNDFGQYTNTENIIYQIDKQNLQKLIISRQEYRIEIVVPNGIFEWFVEIYNSENVELISEWYECYGSEKSLLIEERQDEIESFLKNILNNEIRVIYRNANTEKFRILQYNNSGIWTDIINQN
jgi:hypothetical protein